MVGEEEGFSSSHNRTSLMPGDPVVGILDPTFGKYRASASLILGSYVLGDATQKA